MIYNFIKMNFLKSSAYLLISLIALFAPWTGIGQTQAFQFVAMDQEIIYEYVGTIVVGAQAPMDTVNAAPPPSSGWTIRGTLKLQRIENNTLAAALAVEKIILFGSNRIFYQNKEMQPVYNPFKIVYGPDHLVSKVKFKTKDPVWSRNFKRGIASAFQLQGLRTGAFVANEPSINGNCSTEYYVTAATNTTLTVKKTSELNSCNPFPGGIHFERTNVPVNPCEFDFQKNVVVGNEAVYELDLPDPEDSDQITFHLKSALVTGLTIVQTFESTGEAQSISSNLLLTYHSRSSGGIVNRLDVVRDMASSTIGLELQDLDHDMTGGRQPVPQDKLIKDVAATFGTMADNLDKCDLNFDEPYDNQVAEIIHLLGIMDIDSLRQMWRDFDIGTSYRQETVRNLFFQILPRIGTSASVRLTKELITSNSVSPATAVSLLVSVPFHVFELSRELVVDCEELLNLGVNNPEIGESAYLSFATLVYNAYNNKKIEKNDFEKYVKQYFEWFVKSEEYDRKMIFLQGLGNLLVGNVADYLDPIIRDESVDTDTRFLAILATLPLVRTRADKVYETYWPLFQNHNTSLELRVISFYTLVLSNPTPARLMSLHNVLRKETNPHLINFYHTTILSMSGTTHPCYQDLKRLLSYMSRHIPRAEPLRFWTTGQYLYDYRDQQYGIGAMLQMILIGDTKTNKPYIGIFEFQTEALGKFSSQLTLIVKARGVTTELINGKTPQKPKDIYPFIVDLLTKLRVPLVQGKPFHLEVIIKSENKFVFSFLLNQRTMQNLSQQEILGRIFETLLANSHINMQTIRWPFMLKYAVPTVLGTPAQITIQSTVLASLRGNMTEELSDHQRTTSRSHQIDARYSSYAVCESTTYNPFLNIEHGIYREQGFLVYMPINNEVKHVQGQSFNVSFSRPAHLTSGASLKSRSLTSTKGTILSTDKVPYEEILRPDTSKLVPMTLFRFELADIGLNVTAESTLIDLTNHLAFLIQSDIKENTKVLLGKNSFMETAIMFAGILQLNAMHIGNNKNFAILLQNEKNTKMDASFSNLRSFSEILIRFEHVSDLETLHSWDLRVDLTNMTEPRFRAIFERVVDNKNTETTTIQGSVENIVFLKRPYAVRGSADYKSTRNVDLSAHVDFNFTAGHSDDSLDLFNSLSVSDQMCPKEILLFHPPPSVQFCDGNSFSNISMLTKYMIDLQVANMPEWYNNIAERVEHLARTFQTNSNSCLNLTTGLHARLDVQPGDLTMNLQLNRENFVFPNVLRYLQQLRDVKYDTLVAYSIEYGITAMCSVIGDQLSSFNDAIFDLTNITSNNSSSNVLLLSECSPQSYFAVFVRKLDNKRYAFKLFYRNEFIEYTPIDEISSTQILVNGKDVVSVAAFGYSVAGINVSINQDGILVIWLDNKTFIQYDMRSIFTIQIINLHKDRVCGLCNAPINVLADYSTSIA